MGNRADKVPHQSYAQVCGLDRERREHREDGDETRIGVSYIFSTDDDDGGDEPNLDEEPWEPGNEVLSSVYLRDECVFARSDGGGGGCCSAEALLRRCAAGDLLEFVGAGRSPHWAVYVGGGQVVHLHRAEVKKSPLTEAAGGRRGRVVNQLYRFGALGGGELVVQRATEQVGLRQRELTWTNSECFAAWCRFGRTEFQMGAAPAAPCRLSVRISDTHAHVRHFHSLQDALAERRRGEQRGRDALIGQLAAQWSRLHQLQGDGLTD